MRKLAIGFAAMLIVGAATILVLGPLTSANAGAAGPVEIVPNRLDRGPDVAVPHVEGRTIVDGDRRIRVQAARVTLLGASGKAYVVVASDADYERSSVLRVRRNGTTKVLLARVNPWAVTMSGDGKHLAVEGGNRPDRTRLAVRSASSGKLVARRNLAGSVSVLDMQEGRMVLGAWGPNRTLWWNALSDATRRISKRTGYAADITGDRLASYTRDPYAGGCSRVTTLSGKRLWRSCRERVAAFSPEGRRMATVHILSDGLGPTQVWARKARGRLEATYTTEWFGAIGWENESALLLEANGRRHATTARCAAGECERAEKLRPVPQPRTAG
jgi:hypothetical protein